MRSDMKQVLEDSFRDYAGETILNRAIVDARDALKPSARLGMYAQFYKGITPSKPPQKSLKSVSAGMEVAYTHGDSSLYNLLARLGKTWSQRYVLEEFQGSTGTIEQADNHAASRYTSMRLAPLAMNLFDSIEKDTIGIWFPNYDDTDEYPSVLPSKGFYNIVNGTMGIATGLSSSIPQFNLKEVNEALIKVLWDRNAAFNEIYCPPDFATGGVLLNEEEVKESLRVGAGKSCRLRSIMEFDETDRAIVIKEIPYGVYTNTIKNQLMEIIEGDENPGVERFLDFSGEKPLLKIYLNRGVSPRNVFRYLCKKTSLEYHFGINMTMLDKGKTPKVFSWREALVAHIEHEEEVYRREFLFERDKAEKRLHIVDGLIKAISMIDEVVRTIKASDTRAEALKNLLKLKFSEAQAKAILEIRLVRLVNLEIQKHQKEKVELEKKVAHLTQLLEVEELFKKEIEKGLRQVAEKHGDPRRTHILDIATEEGEVEELEEYIVYLTSANRLLVSDLKQVPGRKFLDKGEVLLNRERIKEGQTALFFSNLGKTYSLTSKNFKGNNMDLINIFKLSGKEQIVSIIIPAQSISQSLIFYTKDGMVKKTILGEYLSVRNGTIGIKLNKSDQLTGVLLNEGERIGLLTEESRLLIFDTENINPIGRATKGVKGINIDDKDQVVRGRLFPKGTTEILTITKKGFAKRTSIEEFPTGNRNTKGNLSHKLMEEDLMIDFVPIKNEKSIQVATTEEFLKRESVFDIPLSSRLTMGSKVGKLRAKERIKHIL